MRITGSVGIDLSALKLPGRVGIRDLWTGRNDGEAVHRIDRMLPSHGAGLYRLIP